MSDPTFEDTVKTTGLTVDCFKGDHGICQMYEGRWAGWWGSGVCECNCHPRSLVSRVVESVNRAVDRYGDWDFVGNVP